MINVEEYVLKVNNISFPTPLSEIDCIDNDNVDVFIELEDGYKYTLVVITPKNIAKLMEQNKQCFLEAGSPMIIVKELTRECIDSAIRAFCEGDAYWLKEYYLSGSFNINLLNEMLEKNI